jgi:hypothetical protein
MAVETSSNFSQVIQDHLELKAKNAPLESEMPLERYMSDDPFENHPLFKSEEQARIEDTMSGQESIVDAPTQLDWPTDDTFVDPPAAPAATPAPTDGDGESAAEPDAESEEGLWTRSRDFDWGD